MSAIVSAGDRAFLCIEITLTALIGAEKRARAIRQLFTPRTGLARAVTKLKTLVFLLAGTFTHLGLMVAVIGARLACGIQTDCVSLGNKIAGFILEFPLGSGVRFLHFAGVDLSKSHFFDERSALWFFAPYVANSLVAVALIWFLLIKLFARWRRRTRAGQHGIS